MGEVWRCSAVWCRTEGYVLVLKLGSGWFRKEELGKGETRIMVLIVVWFGVFM
jgi:hypothetical protein